MAFTMKRYDELVFSVESQKAVPAPFLTKTYQLVDDPLTDHIVSWGEYDTSFVVWTPPEFARDLLPNYFKHNNFYSFVKQLNTYGFKKVVAHRWEFANEYFRKGEKQLLSEIHRRKTPQNHQYHYHEQQPQFLKAEESFGWMESPPPSRKPSIDILTALSQDNQRLRRKNYMLVSELTHMKNLYNDIIYFIQNYAKPMPYPQKANSLGPKIIELGPSFEDPIRSGIETAQTSAFGKSSVTLTEKEPNNRTVKLFGVPLNGRKRLHPEKINQQKLQCGSPLISFLWQDM
ncbi:heat stress transcription factor B-4-like [Durio zibethinus]|uniref:Heat stress transcription factor B-4-like n=1 Tax=Durio zibethinus TaxID=66656 RepID=A0A6P5ZME5_DURZI|nr:heat stress transcription factor B-4-like [Durio zibethinus]